MKTKISVIILLSIFAVLTISCMRQNSATCDEIAHHIPVGYVLLTKWDFKMDTSQPPLPRYIVALPLKLFMKINISDDKAVWRVADRSVFGRDFFYKYNNDQVKMVFFARMAVVFIGVLCGLLLFIWANSLWGERSALFGLFLYVFSPDILAHSGLATTDMIATFFIFLSCYSFWLFLKSGTTRNTVFAGVCLGLAQLSKYTAILLYPVFLLVLIFELFMSLKEKRSRPLLKFFLIVLLSLLVVWAGYGFDFQPILKDTMRLDEKLDMAHNIAKKILPGLDQKILDKFLLETPLPLGSHMLGIMGVFRHGYVGHKTFFLGKWSGHGDPLYFLLAFLIKTPIPMIVFLISGIFVSLRRKSGIAERLTFIVIAVFFITTSFSGLRIGLRHLLPIYPFCFMIAGRSIELLKKRFLNLGIGLLMFWYAFSAITAWPNYLGYFNEIIGGSGNGYKYLRDSNVDWGQGLPSLSAYMNKNNIKEVVLEYFGQADPAVYDVHYRKFRPNELEVPENSVYAVSAQYLEHIKWTKDRKPTALTGYSIFVYDFTKGSVK